MIKAIVFDFDGTLVNTLYDLQDSINEALIMNGYSKQYTYEETKKLIGSGTRVLCSRALNYIEHTIKDEEKLFNDFSSCYLKNQLNKTKPYPKVIETLEYLKKKEIKIAILSNKVEKNTLLISSHLFKDGLFDYILGQRKEFPLKPDSTSLKFLLNELNVNSDEVLYVGDSETDMITADNLKVKKIAVTYGYRDISILKQYNPDYIINDFEELISIL